jgi:hypothetical protein
MRFSRFSPWRFKTVRPSAPGWRCHIAANGQHGIPPLSLLTRLAFDWRTNERMTLGSDQK